MEKQDLLAIIENEISAAIGSGSAGTGGGSSSRSSQLSTERAMELDYYNSAPLGNEKEGESQVVTSDVFDAVEGMLPHLLKTFTASDDAVIFEPVGPEDDEAASQRTEVCNYVFYKQNNGFLLMYEWFKDALIQKNGTVKYWWEKKKDTTEDVYYDLTEGEYLKLTQDESAESVEVLEHETSDDPEALKQKQAMIEKLTQAVQQDPRAGQMLAQIQSAPLPQLHDIKVKIVRDVSKICIQAIPPEEFGVSALHTCISIQDAPFVYHRTRKTISYLKEMGCPDSVIKEIGAGEDGPDTTPEVLARNRYIDEAQQVNLEPDDSQRLVWVTDCFLRVDFDGDGIAELRHIIQCGNTIWINDPADHINYASITPIIMPHRWVGKSVAEIVMDVQYTSSVLWRQMLNNLYLTNNPQKVVLGSAGGVIQADLDRLMTSRVGGILVEYQPNAIRNQEVPFVAGASFPMMEFMQGVKENRTGVTRYNQGTDADSLNKTARGINLIQTAAQQKMDLIARIFAETGVKDLFRGIAYFLSKYSSRKMTIRLRNKWVDVDPREWATQYDMTVNVGLGTGNKDAQLVHLDRMHQMQIQLMESGRGYMVTDQNVFNLAKKTSENMGFKHPDLFITDPSAVQKPPPQPNPDMLKLQQQDMESKAKIQSNERIRQFDAQKERELEAMRQQGEQIRTQMQIQGQKEIESMKLRHDAEMGVFKENNAMVKNNQQLTDQTGQASQQLEREVMVKSTELDLREMQVRHAEEKLALKQQMDGMIEQHTSEMTKANDGKTEEREAKTVTTVQKSMDKVAKELANLATIFKESLVVQIESRDLLLKPPPRNVNLGNIQTDAKGQITGANVATTLQ